uniref:Major facilitator superfamily transporter n=1 Tax=Ganoderma boninense TaxID=34458 RepID=A0A5K1K0V5_9APHY|nr:Major facilitator superfamily transporter [Ganoderma boninense]
MERKRMELALLGSIEPFPVRGTAAPSRSQTLPPIPPTPEFLNKKNSSNADTRTQDIPVAGPSSVPLDEPANIVLKESPLARPSLPPPFILPPPSRPPVVTSASSRISCEGWSIPGLCREYSNFHEVHRVKASTVFEDLSRIMEKYETVGNPLIIEGWHEHPGWRPDLLNLDWLLAEVGDKEMHIRDVHNRRDFSSNLPTFVDMCRKQPVYQEPGGDTYTAAHKDICSSSGHNLMCFSENGGSAFWFMTESKDASKAAEYFQKALGQELDWEVHVTTLEELGKAPFDVYVAEQKVGDLVLVPPRSVHQVVNHGGLAMKTSWSRMTLRGLKTALHSELPVYRRVCRPEQYRIKTVLYRTMLHHTESLQSSVTSRATSNDTNNGLVSTNTLDLEYSSDTSDSGYELPSTPPPRPTIEQRVDTLRSLVGLFDEVLLEEYAACHDSLPRVLGSDRSGWSVTTETSMRRKVVLVPPSNPRDPTERQQAGACNFACDFCGADIFQSFFECRACAGLLGQSTQPGDGFLVCPGCYVEGRSCECDEMEPVQCRPLDALITARNRAAEVLRQVAPTSNVKGPSELHESHLNEHKDIRLFEAACAYRDLKLKRYADSDRQCRAMKSDIHMTTPSTCLRCPVCKVYKCFLHFLRADTHVAEAILAFSKNEHDLHIAHRENNIRHKHSPLKLYDVHGSRLKTRLTIAARSFPRCKPWHAKMRVGFYDTEFALESEPDEEPSPTPSCSDSKSSPRPTPPQLDLGATSLRLLDEGEVSPLTSLDSDSPERPATATLCPEGSDRMLGETEELICSVDKADVRLGVFGDHLESNQHRSPSVSPTATAVDATSEVEVSEIVTQLDLPRTRKARRNKAYVEISRPKLPKRTASSSSSDLEWVDEPQPKKSRSTYQRAGEMAPRPARGRSETRPEPGATRPSASRKSKARDASEDGLVEASYGTELALALSKAGAVETPIFTQPERPSGPLPRRPTVLKRIVSPHSGRGSSPTCSDLVNPTTQPPPTPVSSEPSSLMNAPPPLPRVKQPTSKNSSKPTPLRSDKLPAALANADVGVSTLKRKRGNPPGVPHDQMDANMASRRREPQSRSPRKKARVAQRLDPEVIVIEDEPVAMTLSRCRSPAPVLRTTSLSGSSCPLPPLPPPHQPEPRDPTPPTIVAAPSHAGSSGQRSVEHQADPHPSDSAPPPVINPAPPSVPPTVPHFTPEPAAGSGIASSSALTPALLSNQAYPPPALGVQPGTSHVNLGQPLAVLSNCALSPESNPTPAHATSLQPMETNDLKAMSSVLGLASTVFASVAALNEQCQQVMQRYDSVQQRLDNLDVRKPSVALRQPSVDELLARVEKMEEAFKLSEVKKDKELAAEREENRQLREQLEREHDEREKITKAYDDDRQQRHHMAVRVRELEGELKACKASLADYVRKDALPAAIEAAVSSSMLPLRTSVEDMVVKAVEKQGALRAATSLPAEQRPADPPPYLSQNGPPGDVRLPPDVSRQAPQPHSGQPPWHGDTNGMYGPLQHRNMSGQPPRAQNGQQFGGNHQYTHDQRRGGYQRGRNHGIRVLTIIGMNPIALSGLASARVVKETLILAMPQYGMVVSMKNPSVMISLDRIPLPVVGVSMCGTGAILFDDSPRDVDKPGPSTSRDTIEDYTSEKSPQSRSDIQESSFTQKAAIQWTTQPALLTVNHHLDVPVLVPLRVAVPRHAIVLGLLAGLPLHVCPGPDVALQTPTGLIIALLAGLHLVPVRSLITAIVNLGLVITLASSATRRLAMVLPADDLTLTFEAALPVSSALLP